jgi:hypothetical protein
MDVKQGEFRSSILTARRLLRRALGKQGINNKSPIAVGQQGNRLEVGKSCEQGNYGLWKTKLAMVGPDCNVAGTKASIKTMKSTCSSYVR